MKVKRETSKRNGISAERRCVLTAQVHDSGIDIQETRLQYNRNMKFMLRNGGKLDWKHKWRSVGTLL